MASYTQSSSNGGKHRYYTCLCGWGTTGSCDKRGLQFKVNLHNKRCNRVITATDDERSAHVEDICKMAIKKFRSDGPNDSMKVTETCSSNVAGITKKNQRRDAVFSAYDLQRSYTRQRLCTRQFRDNPPCGNKLDIDHPYEYCSDCMQEELGLRDLDY